MIAIRCSTVAGVYVRPSTRVAGMSSCSAWSMVGGGSVLLARGEKEEGSGLNSWIVHTKEWGEWFTLVSSAS